MFKKNKQKESNNNVRHLIAKINPTSPITEQYRTLRTNIQFSTIDEKVKTIIVTSAEPSAGKSMTAANLAIVYAQQGFKTLLVDADMRKPTVHYTFRMDNITGLSNALIDNIQLEELAASFDVNNLSVISSGPLPPNPAELLGSKRFDQLLASAREVYDVIVIDTAPLLAVTDAQILSTKTDGVVIVTRSGSTETEGLKHAIDLVSKVRGRLLGIVLNDVEKENDNYYYYYGN